MTASPHVETSTPTVEGDDRRITMGWRLLALANSLVIALSALRGVGRGYTPLGDNALIELRGRDVLTENHPLLGTWSSASISSGIDVNHPGPLLFELVALPVKLFGGGAGIAVAIALLNISVVWLVGWLTARTGGPRAALVAQVITAGLVWTLGSELLYDPWQPNVLVLPFWLFLCCIWAVAADIVVVLPLTVGVGTFVMQTHLGYLFIVPILFTFAFASVLLRRRTLELGRFDDLRRPVMLSLVVAVVLWAQPLWEQLFAPGRGNIGRIIVAGTVGGDDFEPVESSATGLTIGLRMLGSVWALPPWWGRPGFDSAIPPSTWVDGPDGQVLSAPGLRSLVAAVVGLLVVATVVALAWRHARRQGERLLEAGFVTLAVAASVAVVTVIITPVDILGLSPHKVRWLWVIGAFATYLLIMVVIAGLGGRNRSRALAVLGGLGVVLVVATVPTHANDSGPLSLRATYPSVVELRDQLGEFATGETAPAAVRFDIEGIGFAEPYTTPVIAELLRNGIELFVDHPAMSRQVGPGRLVAAVGGDADADALPLVYVRAGQEALEIPAGAERIAFHDGDRSAFSPDDVTDRAVAVFLVRNPLAAGTGLP